MGTVLRIYVFFPNPDFSFLIPDPGSKRPWIPDSADTDPQQRILVFLTQNLFAKLSEIWTGRLNPVTDFFPSRIEWSKKHWIRKNDYSWTHLLFQVRLLSIVHYNEVKRLLDKRAALLVDVRYYGTRLVQLIIFPVHVPFGARIMLTGCRLRVAQVSRYELMPELLASGS